MSKEEVGTQRYNVTHVPLETVFSPDIFVWILVSFISFFQFYFVICSKMIPLLLFVLCKYFLWAQLLLAAATTAVAVNKK